MSLKKIDVFPFALILCATVAISTSGIFARMMMLFPPFVIWIRCVLALMTLVPVFLYKGGKIGKLPFSNRWVLISGLMMTLHWVLFFYSLNFSSVAIAAVSVFTYPVITLVMETAIGRKPFDWLNIVLGFCVVMGVYMLANDDIPDSNSTLGVILGVLSAVAYAIRNLASEKLVQQHSSLDLYISQLIVTSGILIFFAGSVQPADIIDNIGSILGLAIITTALGHWMLLQALKYFSAGQSGLMASAQPVIAILLAYLILGEKPQNSVYIGGLIITSTVLISYIRVYLNAQRS